MDKVHLVYLGAQWQVSCYFHEIKLGDVDRIHGYEACTIEGNIPKHAIQIASHLNKTLS
jgi:hypothetical protein